jgi:NitT/TauT family transport system ATP-binding protein
MMSETKMPIVSVLNVSMKFRNARLGTDTEVLRAIDLDIYEGEFVCLVGPSGCGKSTLLNVVGGFLKASQGEVLVEQKPVSGPSRNRLFIFQEGGVFPWLTVRQNIGFGLSTKSKKEQCSIVNHYVRMVGLNGFEDVYPRVLSGGMRQRVELARALAANPRILFMDEPFGALDYLTRLQMRSDLIRICQAERKTVLFVTHDIDEAIQLADRILVMSNRPSTLVSDLVLVQPRPRDVTQDGLPELRSHILDSIMNANQPWKTSFRSEVEVPSDA